MAETAFHIDPKLLTNEKYRLEENLIYAEGKRS